VQLRRRIRLIFQTVLALHDSAHTFIDGFQILQREIARQIEIKPVLHRRTDRAAPSGNILTRTWAYRMTDLIELETLRIFPELVPDIFASSLNL